MPRGDRTGPMGQGAMSGRGMGFCAGYPNPGFTRGGRMGGFGRGMGRGFGRGCFRGGYAAGWPAYGNPPVDVPAISEKEALKQQSDYLKQQLKQIDDRLDQIKED